MKTLKRVFSKRRTATFYTTFIAQLLLVIQLFLALFGLDEWLNIEFQNKIMLFVNGALTLLGLLGVVVNPTTPGISDKGKW